VLPAADDGGVASEVLPVRFAIVQEQLLVFDRDTGEPLTALEAERRRRLEAEVRRLRKLLEERR
jgi:ABC-type nitrate/sulfonate/bicarbonate transport system ATPase subunit